MPQDKTEQGKSTGKKPSTDSIERRPYLAIEPWREYIKQWTRREYVGAGQTAALVRIFNGSKVQGENHIRRVYGWENEKRLKRVGFYTADSFLQEYGLTIEDFFSFCRAKGYEPWYGKPDRIEENRRIFGG